jgi:hypothetical protein
VSPTEGVISEAWVLYKAHWRHLLPISFIVYVTIAIIGALLTALLSWLGALIAVLISLVGLFWVQGALATAVEDIRDGRADLSLGETFSRVRPRLVSIVVAGVLAGIGVFVGLLLLIVPGLVLMTWWVLIIPVVALERTSAGAAFGRSRALEVFIRREDAEQFMEEVRGAAASDRQPLQLHLRDQSLTFRNRRTRQLSRISQGPRIARTRRSRPAGMRVYSLCATSSTSSAPVG